jgi:hypothetical protein
MSIQESIGQNYRSFIDASSRYWLTAERTWFPMETTMRPFCSQVTMIAKDASVHRTRGTTNSQKIS